MVILDASPLIYLGKLDALDVLTGDQGVVPPAVEDEVVRPALAFSYPEIVRIEQAFRVGWLTTSEMTPDEARAADELGARVRGLHRGELEVLAMGLERGTRVCLHERQAARIAAALGIGVTHVVELLFTGTADNDLLGRRLRAFGRITNLAMDQLDELLSLARER